MGQKKFSGFGYKTRAKLYAKMYSAVTGKYADIERRGKVHVVYTRSRKRK